MIMLSNNLFYDAEGHLYDYYTWGFTPNVTFHGVSCIYIIIYIIYMYICLCHICIIYVVKEVASLRGLSLLMGVVHNEHALDSSYSRTAG